MKMTSIENNDKYHISDKEDEVESLAESYITVYNDESTGVTFRVAKPTSTSTITSAMTSNRVEPAIDGFESDGSIPILSNSERKAMISKLRASMNKQKENVQSLSTTKGSIPDPEIIQQRNPCSNPTQDNSNNYERFSRNSILSLYSNSDSSRSTFSKRPLYSDSVLQGKSDVSPIGNSPPYYSLYGEGSRNTKSLTKKNKTKVSHINKVSKDDIANFVSTKLLRDEFKMPKTNISDVNIPKHDNVFKTLLIPQPKMHDAGVNELSKSVFKTPPLTLKKSVGQHFAAEKSKTTYVSPKKGMSDRVRPVTTYVSPKKAMSDRGRPHLNETFSAVTLSDSSDDEFRRRRSYFKKKLYEKADNRKPKTKPKESHEEKLSTKKYKIKVNFVKKLIEKKVKIYISRNSRRHRAKLDFPQTSIDNEDRNRISRSHDNPKSKKGDLLSAFDKLSSKKYTDASNTGSSISDDEFQNIMGKLNKNKVSLRNNDSNIGLKLQRKPIKRLYGSLDKLSSDASDLDSLEESSESDYSIIVLPKKRNRSVLQNRRKFFMTDYDNEPHSEIFHNKINKVDNTPNKEKQTLLTMKGDTKLFIDDSSSTERELQCEPVTESDLYGLNSNVQRYTAGIDLNGKSKRFDKASVKRYILDNPDNNMSTSTYNVVDDKLKSTVSNAVKFTSAKSINSNKKRLTTTEKAVDRSVIDDSSANQILSTTVIRKDINVEKQAESRMKKSFKRSIFDDFSDKVQNKNIHEIRTHINDEKQPKERRKKAVKRSIFSSSSDEEQLQIKNINEIRTDINVEKRSVAGIQKTVKRSIFASSSDEEQLQIKNINEIRTDINVEKRSVAGIQKTVKRSIFASSSDEEQLQIKNINEIRTDINVEKRSVAGIQKTVKRSIFASSSDEEQLQNISINEIRTDINVEKQPSTVNRKFVSRIPVKVNSIKPTNKNDLRINMKAKNRTTPQKSLENNELLKEVMNSVAESVQPRRSLRNSLTGISKDISNTTAASTQLNCRKIKSVSKNNTRNSRKKILSKKKDTLISKDFNETLDVSIVDTMKSRNINVSQYDLPSSSMDIRDTKTKAEMSKDSNKNTPFSRIDTINSRNMSISQYDLRSSSMDTRDTKKKANMSKDSNKNTPFSRIDTMKSRNMSVSQYDIRSSSMDTRDTKTKANMSKDSNKNTPISRIDTMNSRNMSVSQYDLRSSRRDTRDTKTKANMSKDSNKNTPFSRIDTMNSRNMSISQYDLRSSSRDTRDNKIKAKMSKDSNKNTPFSRKDAMNTRNANKEIVIAKDTNIKELNSDLVAKNSILSESDDSIENLQQLSKWCPLRRKKTIEPQTSTPKKSSFSAPVLPKQSNIPAPVLPKRSNILAPVSFSRKDAMNTRNANKEIVIAKDTNIKELNSDLVAKNSILSESDDSIENLQQLSKWCPLRRKKTIEPQTSTPKKSSFSAPVLPKQSNIPAPVLPKRSNILAPVSFSRKDAMNTRNANKEIVIAKDTNIKELNSDLVAKNSILSESDDSIENLQQLSKWCPLRRKKTIEPQTSTPKKSSFSAPVLPKQLNIPAPVLPKRSNILAPVSFSRKDAMNTRNANKEIVIAKDTNIKELNSDLVAKNSILSESDDSIENLQQLSKWCPLRRKKTIEPQTSTPKKSRFSAPVLPKKSNIPAPVLPKRSNILAPVLTKRPNIPESETSMRSVRSRFSYYGIKSQCSWIEGENGNFTLRSDASTVNTKKRV